MSESQWPQPGRERLIVPAPVGLIGTATPNPEEGLLRQLDERHVMMMGDNPALARMPKCPSLMDFYRLRFSDMTARHLLTSAARALEAGQEEKVVVACSRLPSFSDGPESIGEDRLVGEHRGEAFDEWDQLPFGHVRHEVVEHGALAEQRMGAALGGV